MGRRPRTYLHDPTRELEPAASLLETADEPVDVADLDVRVEGRTRIRGPARR